MSTAPAELTAANLTQLEREDEERQARLAAPDALANAALWYATVAGWPVFPLWPGGKAPRIKSAHEPGSTCTGECGQLGHGLYDATTDPTQVRGWWQQWPQANIGTRTGLRFDVIDVDGPDGYHSLAVMRHSKCPPDCCSIGVCWPDRTCILDHETLGDAHTGGGGRHILIRPTGQGNGAKIAPGIDYRGEGGYIVLAPSLHESGNRYSWIATPDERLLGVAA